MLLWGDSSNTHHASEVKALCITAHCCMHARCGSDTDVTYVAVVAYESTRLYQLINDLNKREKVSKVPGAGDHLS